MGIPDTRVSIERRTHRTYNFGKVSASVHNVPKRRVRVHTRVFYPGIPKYVPYLTYPWNI